MDTEEKKTQWHPAFEAAMHLEFKENEDDLKFQSEVTLNELPLKIDMLLVKKRRQCVIQNEIGSIFRGHNLIEYKSPKDSLNFNTFLKGLSYVYLYKLKEKHLDDIPLTDITLSFIRDTFPRELFKRLKKEKFSVEEVTPGIYYISEEHGIKIQIVVTKQLSQENHIWINALTKNMKKDHVKKLIYTSNELKDSAEHQYADAIMQVVLTENKKIKEWLKEEDKVCQALIELMKPEIDEARIDGQNEGLNKERMRQIKAKLEKGKEPEEIADALELSLEEVNRLISTISINA